MPYSSADQGWNGPEARSPRETARETFIAVLDAILNAPDQPYKAQFNLAEDKRFEVTNSVSRAGELWGKRTPLVLVMNGAAKSYGKARVRHEIMLKLDVGVLALTGGGAQEQQRLDALSADLVSDAVSAHLAAFKAAGLAQITVRAFDESQRAAQGRNPLQVMCWLTTLPQS